MQVSRRSLGFATAQGDCSFMAIGASLMLRRSNVASLTSFVAKFELAVYSAGKAAVASLTKSLVVDWAPHGVCERSGPGRFSDRSEYGPS
jgi:NAD(P)-dependent dehydrogenase (short-subunit alcohol dehydrogenase family)